jgi:Ca2+-binding EF-hand superfamily protein
MSTALREAAQQILVAWDNDDSGTMDHPLSAAIEALRATLEQQEQFISLQELAEALGEPDIDSDSEIDKDDILDMVELQRELLFYAISLNSKMRKRKT